MKYRDHRGGLNDAMATAQEFTNISQLKAHLSNIFNEKIVEIKFEYACYDDRIGWDTYYVCIKLKNDKEFGAVGMSDGILK